MKLAIDLTTKKIIDLLPDSATSNNKFLLNNNYILFELENPYKEDGSFIELTNEHLKSYLLEQANKDFEAKVTLATLGTPDKEQSSWIKQEAEALAWTLDNTSPTPFIDGIMSTREKYKNDKPGLVAKILEKAKSAFALGAITGERQDIEDKL